MPFLRARRERPDAPLHGFKLAHPVVSADGARGGFTGVTVGRSSSYGVVGTAECAQGARHRSPSRWCDCGFYCLHRLDAARALACDPDYRYTVLLEVEASGRFLRYERGLRYEHQKVTAVRTGRCGCGCPATLFTETGAGLVGWRRLMAACATCAGRRPRLSLSEFARLLGGPPVTTDEPSRPAPADAGAPSGGPVSPAAPPAPAVPAVPPGLTLDEVDRDALVPLLSAEVALLQARLDEVQQQLLRLTGPPGL
jgi:hypothetical protein